MRFSQMLPALVIGLSPVFAGQPPLVATDPQYRPLSAAQRWDHYWHETFLSPGLYFAALGAASGGQLARDPPEWGQGLAGYSRRSASLFGMFTIQTTVHEAGAAAFKLDPRYIRSGRHGLVPRFSHAVAYTFVTYDENRHVRPDVPRLAGAYGSGMLSTLWYPHRYDALSDGVRLGHQQIGLEASINVIKEFGPELKWFFTFGRVKRSKP